MVSGVLFRGDCRRRQDLPLFNGGRPCGGGSCGGSCRLLVALAAGGTPPAAARARRVQSRLQGLQGRDGEVCGLGTGPLDVCDGRAHEQPAPRSGRRRRRRRGRGRGTSLVAPLPLQLLHVERGRGRERCLLCSGRRRLLSAQCSLLACFYTNHN